jgi:hypothetical protein
MEPALPSPTRRVARLLAAATLTALLATLLVACTDDSAGPGQTGTGLTAGAGGAAGGTGGQGGSGGQAGSGASGGNAGSGGCDGPAKLEALLQGLRTDLAAAEQAQSEADGWPAPVCDGYLFVSDSSTLTSVAGDHDAWAGTPMTADQGFHWLVLPVAAGDHYKFTNGVTYLADPWSRAYIYDDNGEMSLVAPTFAHLERYFAVADANMQARTVRLWLPVGVPSHVLYVHDGQNLFDPAAPYGGWKLQDSVPDGMMLVGIDNTPARMDEYTHVQDFIDGGLVGGLGDEYADFVQSSVRGLVADHYAEPTHVGVMGSSLGGLISFHVALRFAGQYDFAASLSGTMGWGSIGLSGGAENETMIQRYAAAGHGSTPLYLDSGGNATACVDSDGDGTEDDDPTASDNYCENRQMEQTLYDAGYVANTDVWHWWEPNATHDEAAWAARVFRPMQIFAGL